MSNIIHVQFNGCLVTQCDTVFQWDYGRTLVFDDLELPPAYEVQFANERYGGETVTQIGNDDGVAVPDVLLTTGKPVYAFLYLHDGGDDGYTERVVSMPVSKRGKPTNEVPTPVQQDAITEAIAALQSAVSETEENVSLAAGYAEEAEGYRDEILGMSVSAETLPAGSDATVSYAEGHMSFGIPKGAQGEQGEPGQDGFSPVVTVTSITGGHEVSVTDKDGTQSFNVMDGATGATPDISVSASTLPAGSSATATRSGTDEEPLIAFGIPRGADGADGVSPTVTVTAITGGHEVSITDAVQTQTFDVMDGDVQSDGVYPQLTAGNAQELDSSLYVTDRVPYLFRASGGGKSVGTRERDAIVGGTVAFNQVMRDITDATNWVSNGGTVSYNNGTIVFSVTGTGPKNFGQNSAVSAVSVTGHKYLYSVWFKRSNALNNVVVAPRLGQTITVGNIPANTDTLITGIMSATGESGLRIIVYPWGTGSTTFEGTETATVHDAMIIDLTQMFGSTIADYLYSLETATAGAGVAVFRKLFPNAYYPYNAGSFAHVSGLSAHVMRGFNQWDEVWENGNIGPADGMNAQGTQVRSKNYIPVIPSTTYYILSAGVNSRVFQYDAEKAYLGYTEQNNNTFTTASNCAYVRFMVYSAYGTTYNNDICINLSWDGERDGEYEPYKKYSYPLDSTLTLRGIPKLDASNNLYYDGDTYEADGTVTRRYGIRAYQSGDESLTDAITDMTNTVYKLNTPTTEQATPFTTPQIVDPNGTEEYVSSGIVPVGHVTEYPVSQVNKLDAMPNSLFYTETAFKATRAYTVNQLLVINGQLYRAKTSISSGATLTVGTNIEAQTLGDIITALLNA